MRALNQSQLGRTLSALALFSVVGCARIVIPGGSAGGNTLSGIVQLARVSGATISVFEMQSDGSKGSLLASTTTNSNGDYTVNLGKYSGQVIIESVGGSYGDEATGATKTASLLSAISEASSATNAPVTPMSTLVKERTLALLATRSLSEAKTQAVSEVAGLFGVSAEDLSVIPTSATALSSLNTRATRAALGLAAFSYFLKDFRHADSEVSVGDALSALAEDLKDDGQINGSTSSTVAKKLAMEWRASMAAAKTAASANSNLVFSKLSSEILAEVSGTTLDTGSELDGLQEDGSFYINGVNTGLQGGTGLFIEKYYYLGGLAQVENGPMEDGYYYKNGEKANEPIGGINYVNGERIVVGVPDVEDIVVGNASVYLQWIAPDDYGSAITDYVIQYSSDSGWTWSTFADGTSTSPVVTVTGLTNGTAYSFRVAAVNAAGTGSYSSNSASVTPGYAGSGVWGSDFWANGTDIGDYDSGTNTVTMTGTPSSFTYDAGAKNFNFAGYNMPSGSTLTTTGTVTFDGGYNSGTITGTVEFLNSGSVQDIWDQGSNRGIVNGAATFNYYAPNWGTVNGDAVFNTVANMGTVTGHATFNSGGNNWTGGVVGTATFNDDSCNDFEGQVLGDATFNDLSYNKLDSSGVGGNATFNDNSRNEGTVTGNAEFNLGAKNYGSISGNATFNAGAANFANIGGDAIFHDSLNSGGVTGSAVFYGNSYHQGTIHGNATFNGSSGTNSPVYGDAIFNDSSFNTGSILGTATYNGFTGNNDWGYFIHGESTSLDSSGNGTWNDRRYSNGVRFSGVFNNLCYSNGSPTTDLDESITGVCNGVFYENGSPRTGVYDGICYNNGSPTAALDESVTGVCNGIYYLGGLSTSLDSNGNGTWNDLRYSAGQLFSGPIDDVFYGDGQPIGNYHNGIATINWNFAGGPVNFTYSNSLNGINFEFINGCNFTGSITTNGTVTFDLNSWNYSGTIFGNTIFGDGYNSGTINGSATFNGGINYGTVTGTCTFNGGINGGGSCGSIVYYSGFYDGLLYSEGSLLTGTAPNGSCYINGVERTESDSFTFGDYGSTPVTDTNLNTLSNYWLPFTSYYAPCFPDSNDTVTITSPVESGTLTAQNISLQSSFSGGTLNGSVTVGKGGEAAGVMTGGTINGDVTFGVTGWASPSYPILEGGTINGNATFTSGSIFVGGTITGTKTWNGFTGQYSKAGASYDGKYFFGGHLRQPEDGPVGGGDYYVNGELANGVAGSGQMYFYANGKLIGTYDGSMASNAYGTVTFTTVPDSNFSYNGDLNFVLTDIHLGPGATLTTNGTITFNGSSNNYGTVNGGETTFNDSALNLGTITGTVTFNDNSRNYIDGIVGTGNATFNDSSYNFGTVGGNATFNNSSFQYGWVDGNVTLNDSSTLDGTVGGAITDNRIASCNDDCYLEGSYPTYAQGLNLGTKRQGPGGTILTLQYANGSSGFKIWKEDNGNRILNATGLIANGWQKMLTRAGTAFSSATDNSQYFTSGTDIAGRVCPSEVFINRANPLESNRCLYYTPRNSQIALNAASAGGVYGEDYLEDPRDSSSGNGTNISWYEGNIKACADKGMRLPVLYEVSNIDPGSSDRPTDWNPSFSSAQVVPSSVLFDENIEAGRCSWSATGVISYNNSGYISAGGANVDCPWPMWYDEQEYNNALVCVLPSH